MLRIVVVLASLMQVAPLSAAVLEVGEGKPFANLQDAVKAAADGDTIRIAPGFYTKGAVISRNRLKIQGAGRDVTIFDSGVVKDKGIFLVTGDDVEVRSLTLQNAWSRYAVNAAGIRAEGRGLVVADVAFKNNDNGILYTASNRANWREKLPPGERGSLTVRNSTFDGNGHGDGQSHGLYASRVDRVLVDKVTFRNTRVGHHLKSRALETTVTNSTFVDPPEAAGASYAIDLPEGGAATITGNRFVKGANASNPCCIIAYGFEMKRQHNPPGPVVVARNSVSSHVDGEVTFFRNRSLPRNDRVTVARNRLSTGRLIEAR